ncbi:hypothetical protein BGW39_009464, partial [Mortierella sp. 14UC]
MNEHPHTGVGPPGPGTGTGGTTPTRTRIPPGTIAQRQSTDDTYIQYSSSTVSDDYYEYDEKSGKKGGDEETGSSVYNGPGEVRASSSYSGKSRTRFTSWGIPPGRFDDKKAGRDGGAGGGDVESQTSSVDSEDNSPIEEFFYLRQNPVSITYTVVPLISLPIGKFLARVLPTTQFRLFGPLGGPRVSLNLGMLRKLLVRPASMIWPANLVTVALFRALHGSPEDDDEDDDSDEHEQSQGAGEKGHEMRSGTGQGSRVLGGSAVIGMKKRRTTRLQYFAYVSLGPFIYYWSPNYIFPTLTAFSILCWINPKNIILSQLTGSNDLGIGTISFDWATSTSALTPLVTPWWAQINILVGFVIVAWIIAPIAYYSNLWSSKSFPILTAGLFREDGTPYDKSMVMTNNVLDPVKYEAYGPLRMDSFFALTYGIRFAGLTATLTHVALYLGKEILDQWRAAIATKDHDIHSRMMMKYKEVPQRQAAMAKRSAVTNQQSGLKVITEYMIGYLMPGHPIANITFKAYGYITNAQALQFTHDLKLGHYMKIPPRTIFWVQVISSVIAGIVNLATTDWLLRVQPNICTKAGYPWTCRNTN